MERERVERDPVVCAAALACSSGRSADCEAVSSECEAQSAAHGIFILRLTENGGGGDGPGGGEGSKDRIDTHRANGMLPAIVWDAEKRERWVVRMR